ncbi:hypothetical protein P8452_47185 [Trifolium repens]|nr:hypothetical protein P8452_47185 [Trifolium repens]
MEKGKMYPYTCLHLCHCSSLASFPASFPVSFPAVEVSKKIKLGENSQNLGLIKSKIAKSKNHGRIKAFNIVSYFRNCISKAFNCGCD